MPLAADILAFRDLVAEGHLSWDRAATELREEHDLTVRELYTTGAAELLQQADPEYKAKVQRVTAMRHLTKQALVVRPR